MRNGVPDLMQADPIFCYRGQIEAVRRFAAELFIMTPLRECALPEQVFQPDRNKPVFFFVKDDPRPVPEYFWPYLEKLGATLVCIGATRPDDAKGADAPSEA
jgi:hypothetical protein